MRKVLLIIVILIVGNFLPSHTRAGELYIRDVRITTQGEGQAKISWVTNQSATGGVVWGESTSYGHYTGSSLTNTYQEVLLVGLHTKTTYHFKIVVAMDGQTVESFDHTFKTDTWKIVKDLELTDVRAIYMGGTAITIRWLTDRNASGTLEVVKLSDYQSSGFKRAIRASHGGSTKSHEVTVAKLSVGTSYYFKVTSKDTDGNTSYREGHIFTTLSSDVNEKKDLIIDQIAPASSPDPLITASTVTFLWHTNRPALGSIECKPVDKKGKTQKVSEIGWSTDSHQLTITGLEPSTTYSFKIYAKDILGKKLTVSDRLVRTSSRGAVLGAYTDLSAQPVQANLRYYTEARRNLALEQKLSGELRTYLVQKFNGRVPYISSANWFVLVRAFTYGGYPGESIAQAVKFGGKTVHPKIFWSAWQTTAEYKNYINR